MPKVAQILLRGARSAQPSASAVIPGTLYFVTDEATTEQAVGGSWLTYADGGGGSGAEYVVLSDGAIPLPSPINDGAGSFIYVSYTP